MNRVWKPDTAMNQLSSHTSAHATAWLGALIVLALSGCSESSGPDASDSAEPVRITVRTQPTPEPCRWIPADEAERALGKFSAPPRREEEPPLPEAIAATVPEEDRTTNTCLYSVLNEDGSTSEIALSVDLEGGQGAEMALGFVSNVVAQQGAMGPGPKTTGNANGWDYAGSQGDSWQWRVGHIAVFLSDSTGRVPEEKLAHFAVIVRDGIPDLPFVNRRPPQALGGPDPCALVTRTEAEAVLGPLVVDPYRSALGTPLAEARGTSCTYFTRNHRALVITPSIGDGKFGFDLMGAPGNVLRRTSGGADEGDVLDGPWDQATTTFNGTLALLKGEDLLELVYRTSSTDIEGAAKIATVALNRLAAK